MELATFQYLQESGWSVKEFPLLDSKNTLVLLFASPIFLENPAPLKDLMRHYPNSQVAGCTSAGEIAGSHVRDNSISVAVVRFDDTHIRLAMDEIEAMDDSYQVGQTLARQLNQDNLKGILVLSKGIDVNGSALVRGINTIGGDHIIVTGGLAGDGNRFKKTAVIYNGEFYDKGVVAIGFYGNKVKIGHGSKGGWDVFGIERIITRSKDNILYELDNRPVLALYKEYLGERASGLPATGLLFPLAIRKNKSDQKQLVRTILGIDEESQSLIFAGDMPMGYLAQLMHANFDRLVTGANEAGKLANPKALQKNGKGAHVPVLAVAISCVGRRLVLGERIEEETESTLSSLPNNTQQVGFYSYGELSPYANGPCDLHNQTMTLTTIYEE